MNLLGTKLINALHEIYELNNYTDLSVSGSKY